MVRQMRQIPAQDETLRQEAKQGEQCSSATEAASQSGEASTALHTVALRLIAELGTYTQMIASDLALAHAASDTSDLEVARQSWVRHLRALADLAAGAPTGQHTSLLPSETPLHALPPYPRRAGTTQPITATTRALVASANDQAPETMPVNPPLPATYRWVPLTVREREVLRLWQRGYSPRRIALRLVISVETVYTHTRNIRRKQRAWEQAHLAQQTRLDAMK